MSLPEPPKVPSPPVYQPVPAQVTPASPSTLIAQPPSYSSSDLRSYVSPTQNNANVVNNRISNIAVTNQNLQGAETQVGNIRVQSAQLYFNGSYNPNYGEAIFTGGVVIPLGGRTAYRSAMRISQVEADGAIGGLCMSIFKNGMTEEMLNDLYGKRAKQYKKCVNPSKIVALTDKARDTSDDRDRVIDDLKAELAQIRAELDAARQARNAVPQAPAPVYSGPGTRALW